VLALVLVACGAAPETAREVVPAEQAPAPSAPEWKHFGAGFSTDVVTPASAVLSDPAAHAGRPVRFRAELTEVCQAKGCWAVVRDGEGHAMRITMKDHAFGIDKDTVGRACEVEGQLVSLPVDPERLQHFASEGGSTLPPEAGKTEAWEIVATAVAVAAPAS
jgi:hypothetical protein